MPDSAATGGPPRPRLRPRPRRRLRPWPRRGRRAPRRFRRTAPGTTETCPRSTPRPSASAPHPAADAAEGPSASHSQPAPPSRARPVTEPFARDHAPRQGKTRPPKDHLPAGSRRASRLAPAGSSLAGPSPRATAGSTPAAHDRSVRDTGGGLSCDRIRPPSARGWQPDSTPASGTTGGRSRTDCGGCAPLPGPFRQARHAGDRRGRVFGDDLGTSRGPARSAPLSAPGRAGQARMALGAVATGGPA